MAILVAEPDEAQARRTMEGLSTQGFTCTRVATGAEVLRLASGSEAVVAETALPDLAGPELAARLRRESPATPLILITSCCDPAARVQGLDAGADDCLCKPFTLPELGARLRALLRRCQTAPQLRCVQVGDLRWESAQRRVLRGGQRLDLTPKEYALLALLLERAGQLISRDEIAQTLWGMGQSQPERRSPSALDAHIRRLRLKVDPPGKPPLLHTQRGLGLVLEAR